MKGAYRLCLVTDDRLAGGRTLGDIVGAAVAGGVTMVQIREKTASTRVFLDQARALRVLLRPLGVPLIVNDRVDIALAVQADGVHVGQDDMPVATVRRLVGPGMLIGLSITADPQLDQPEAEVADYFGIGPIFQQATKADAAAPLGLDGLARLRAATRKPILAIGGIGLADAAAVRRAGADGLAVVSALMAVPDPRAAAAHLRAAMDAVRPD